MPSLRTSGIVPFSGGSTTKRLGATISAAVISEFFISADASRVAVCSHRGAVGVIELYVMLSQPA